LKNLVFSFLSALYAVHLNDENGGAPPCAIQGDPVPVLAKAETENN